MKPESTADQILAAANKAAYFKLIGKPPGTPHELSQASIQALMIVSAIVDALPLEQKLQVLETLKNL